MSYVLIYYIQFDNNYNNLSCRGEEGDVNSIAGFIQTANHIVESSDKVVRIATQIAELCTNKHLKSVSYRELNNISIHTYSTI